MARVSVYVEEHLCREIEVDVSDDLNMDQRMEYAEQMVREGLNSGEVKLTVEDFTGVRLLMIKDHRTGAETSWNSY